MTVSAWSREFLMSRAVWGPLWHSLTAGIRCEGGLVDNLVRTTGNHGSRRVLFRRVHGVRAKALARPATTAASANRADWEEKR